MSIVEAFGFNDLPKEIREEIYVRFPTRSLFGLSSVCRLWNTELSNDFFNKRCLALFEEISRIPRFYSLLVGTAQTPWKAICFSLSRLKVNDQLKPKAEQLAKSSLPNVRPYLQRRVDQFQAERNQAIERFKAKYQGEEPFLGNQEVYWKSQEKLFGEFRELGLALGMNGSTPLLQLAIRDILPELTLEFPETDVELALVNWPEEENPDLSIRILKAALRLQLGINADARLIQFIKLGSQYTAGRFSQEIILLTDKIDFYNFLMGSQDEFLEKGLKQSYFNTLSLLPLLRNWMPHLDGLRKINTFRLSPRLSVAPIASAKLLIDFIHSLPNPLQNRIWQAFTTKYGIGEQELQSNPNHYPQQLYQLSEIIYLETPPLSYFDTDSEDRDFFFRDWSAFQPSRINPNYFNQDLPAIAAEPAATEEIDQ